MDFKVIIYLVLLGAFYLFKFIRNQQKKREEAQPPILRKQEDAMPKTVSAPAAVKPYVPAKSSLESLFEEFGVEKRNELIEKPEPIISYENPETKLQVETVDETEFNRIQLEEFEDRSRFDAFKNEKKDHPNNIKKQLGSVAELRKVFIASEIFKTKF